MFEMNYQDMALLAIIGMVLIALARVLVKYL